MEACKNGNRVRLESDLTYWKERARRAEANEIGWKVIVALTFLVAAIGWGLFLTK